MKFLAYFLLAAFGFSSLAMAEMTVSRSHQCVDQCVARDHKGKCKAYGEEFCAPNARCAKRCVSRAFNGTCVKYTADFCGKNAKCVERCLLRTNGYECSQYGHDQCYEGKSLFDRSSGLAE